jgi:ribosome-binding factor A
MTVSTAFGYCILAIMMMSHRQAVVDAFLLLPQSALNNLHLTTTSTATSHSATTASVDDLRRISHFASSALASSSPTSDRTSTSSALHMAYNSNNSGRYNDNNQRTKRQERVGQVVRTELANILHRGHIQYLNNNNAAADDGEGSGPLEDELRRRISIVNADVSPDLRRARVTISIIGRKDRKQSEIIDKRRAYAWLIRNTKSIRHALSSKMAHMKGGSPELTFVQVDVGAAVDVMNLIDKVSNGYKREDVGDEDWKSMMMEMEDEGDEEDEDDGWIDEDEDENDEEDGDWIDEESEETNNDAEEDAAGEAGGDTVSEEDEWLDFDEEDKE